MFFGEANIKTCFCRSWRHVISENEQENILGEK